MYQLLAQEEQKPVQTQKQTKPTFVSKKNIFFGGINCEFYLDKLNSPPSIRQIWQTIRGIRTMHFHAMPASEIRMKRNGKLEI
jgi:hypothetical protein